MYSRSITVIVVGLSFHFSFGQCVVSDFTISGSSSPVACSGKVLEFHNESQNAANYEWDFCPGDLASAPVGSMVTTLAAVQTFDALKIVKDGSYFYGFIVKQSAGGLFRLNFGSDPSSTPLVESLGTFGMGGAADIELIQDNGVWFALVASGSNLVRLKFTAGLGGSAVSITSTNLGSFGGVLNSVRGLELVKSGGDYYAVATSSTLNTITIIKFTGSMTGATAIRSKLVPGAAQLLAVNLFKECGSWFGLLTSVGNNRLIKCNFGTNLLQDDAFQFTTQSGVNIQSFGMDVLQENGNYYIFLATINSPSTLLQLNFGNNVWQNNPEVVNHGSLSGLAGVIGMDFVHTESEVIGFLGNRSNYQLHRVNYRNDCPASLPSSTMEQPMDISFEKPGDYPIILKAFDADGNAVSASRELHVYNGPTLNFSFNQACENANTAFTQEIVDVEFDIASWNWNFAGLSTSHEQDPFFQFPAAAYYDVNLQVTDVKGCSRTVGRNIKIYDDEDITPDFSYPQLFCSNSIMGLTDASTFVEDEIVAWRWSFNDIEGNSIEQNPSHTFSDSGLNKIALMVTGASGCSYSVSKEIQTLSSPEVSFELNGNYCQDQVVEFVAVGHESLSSISWDFGDGNVISGSKVSHVFANTGQYDVLLTAESPNGCISGKSTQINIRSLPHPDFAVEAPPLSCTATPTPFSNLTTTVDGIITEWNWSFNDGLDITRSIDEYPQHTFSKPGEYTVSLLATTSFGCAAEGSKQITIHESPSAVTENSIVCNNIAVTFLQSQSDEIAHSYWEIGTSYYYTPSPVHTFRTPGDFPVYLQVTGTNGCIAEASKIVHVPIPLSPDFSVIKNCVDQEAIFKDITTGEDPVASRSWNFNPGGHFTGDQVGVNFKNPGNTSVTLKVTGESGCTYEVSRATAILPSPHANFTATPTTGGYPLEVQFTNTSSGATYYDWSFANATSNEISPVHTFYEAGEFNVKLTAYNEQQCEHSVTSIISAVAPLPDADIDLITLSPNSDGTYRLIVTIHNKGNTYLRNLPVDIDFGGDLQLREVVSETIAPSSKHNLVLGTNILKADILEYLCVSMDVSNDISITGNRKCLGLEQDVYVFNVFPNPTSQQVTLEWISKSSKLVRISLFDRLGKLVLADQLSSTIGLNRQLVNFDKMEGGVYFLVIDDGLTRHRQRILVSNNR